MGKNCKTFQVHRFVLECFNGLIPEDEVVNHINNNKELDNRLCNLQLMTRKENCKKAAKHRDYTFSSKNHQNKKCVRATNLQTEDVSLYNSL